MVYLFVDGDQEEVPKGMNKTVFNKLMAGRVGQILKSEGFYDDKRTYQALRWLATIIFCELQKCGVNPIEVQIHFDKDNDPHFIVSTNNTTGNKALLTLFKDSGGTMRGVLEKVLRDDDSEARPNIEHLPEELQLRHAQKAEKYLAGDQGFHSDRYGDIQAVMDSPVTVVPPEKAREGLHAERHIKEYKLRLRREAGKSEEFNGITAGTRPPCGVCAADLYPGEAISQRGATWPSKSATVDFPLTYTHAVQVISVTNVVVVRNSFNYLMNVPSDSEPE